MLKRLDLENVGPATSMALEFGERLNVITGDNGLGKSFLLDFIWWTHTGKWPAEVNPRLTAGKKALPSSAQALAQIPAAISCAVPVAVVTPRPSCPKASHRPGRCGCGPISGKPSGVAARKPVQLRMICSALRPGR